MEDDDEFGDLYTDVLRPLTSSAPPPQASAPHPQPQPPPSPPRRPIDFSLEIHDDEIISGAALTQTPAPESSYSAKPRVLDPPDAKFPRSPPNDPKLVINPKAEAPPEATKSVDLMETDVKFDIEEDDGPAIPGVSDMPLQSNGGGGAGDDWDSDSEDELQIVLNENPQHGPVGVFDEEDDDDEDGDPLVIVGGGVSSQPMEDADWGEEAGQVGADGERKEAAGAEAAKAGGTGASAPPKIGYSSHGYHPFHSQFKYVRPGAAPIPASSTLGSAGTPGQVRPLVNAVPMAGRGRGEWRPAGMKGGPGLQKYPGYGAPPWGSGRSYGGGLEFTLPSHKTIFEVDIDSFEEKPWKYPGVDNTDFFNFGLNEESWKDYCKQLEQHRLENTMQSRIRVYESVRTEQEFDPDMPPELAAATGIHDVAENANAAKSGAGQIETKLPARVRPPLPTGRAIQVENGLGERLPSIDTRPPRIRDSDAIIEIMCQDDDNSSSGHGVPDQHDIEQPSEARDHMAKREIAHADNENSDSNVEPEDSQKREPLGRRTPAVNSAHDDAAEGDEPLPPRSIVPVPHPSASKGQTPFPVGTNGIPQEERTHIGARGRSPYMSPAYSTEDRKSRDDREGSVESMGRKSPAHESSLGRREVTPVPGDRISEQEKEDAAIDEGTPTDNLEDGGLPRSRIKRKISPQAEEPGHELNDGEDSRAGRSSENSKARSGSSRESQKWHDGVEEEVVQAGRPSRPGSTKRHLNRVEQDYRRKSHETTQEMERSRMVAKGQEGSYRDWDRDQSIVHNMPIKHEGSDRRKDRDPYDRSWQWRDDDPQNRRDRAEDTRKRDRADEIGSRHRSRARESERSEKDEHLHLSSRKHIENGIYEANFDKDVGPRVRERDDSSRSGRHESAGEYHSKRRREDDYSRRDHVNKEEILHTHKESTNRQKRERDDDRKRDEQPRGRDDISLRHKDDASSNRERSEKQKNREGSHRPRPAQDEDVKREREGQGSQRSGRGAEDKARAAHVRTRDNYKISDKDHHSKDKPRNVEQVKVREHAADEISSHHRGREDGYSRGNQINYEDKRSRQERPVPRNDQRMRERGHKGIMKKSKESEGGDNNSATASKRIQDDQMDRVNETGGGNRDNPEVTLHHQSSRKNKEDASSDDEQNDSRRGRSKLERWTSHKERDFTISSQSTSSLKFKELGRNSNGGTTESSSIPVDPSKPVETSATTQQAAFDERDKTSDAQTKNNADNKAIDNRHLDTVEKLKKRSERFKLPMPSGKEAVATKKIENEALSSGRTETPLELETKHERPARKRRWVSN
ncbi:FIP1[V]-like protein isoform X1 [Punica granatum]|uniref:Uncharacterized protein n=2 Tax=Punica granatum TaxID=22663 RepID=A0A2I0J7T9_PUNGR|nr:FIP1[V]-like protein isoform X1 [Punica granatum]PKI52322.1 hypothetical protein CRG98_027248 [Punica granatum]